MSLEGDGIDSVRALAVSEATGVGEKGGGVFARTVFAVMKSA
jgi:hypothetical protein